jgi:hypothetical protein
VKKFWISKFSPNFFSGGHAKSTYENLAVQIFIWSFWGISMGYNRKNLENVFGLRL